MPGTGTAVYATEIFADVPTTTQVSGGTTAPASGTQETWTVSSSSTFPAPANGAEIFYVADPALPTELIRVITVSGATWTVIRGAQGTATVAHTNGFTIRQVVSQGWYTQVPSPGLVFAMSVKRYMN